MRGRASARDSSTTTEVGATVSFRLSIIGESESGSIPQREGLPQLVRGNPSAYALVTVSVVYPVNVAKLVTAVAITGTAGTVTFGGTAHFPS